MAVDDSGGCFLHERPLFFHSLFLCLHLSLSLFLAGCVESERCFVCLQPGGKTELQSQAAKWWKTLASRDVLCLDQELRAREKCSLFNLTLFSYYISSLLLFSVSVFPSSGQAIFFSFFFMSACTAALEQVLLVGDGWMDEVVKRRRAKGWAENWMFTWVCVCVYVWIVGMRSDRGRAVFRVATLTCPLTAAPSAFEHRDF